MNRFNLSAWAVREQALTLFIIICLSIAGTFAFLKLGRAETPEMTFKAMTLSVQWPGATAAEIQSQVADRLEKRLQELRYLDRIETTIRPGQATMLVVLKDSMPSPDLQGQFYQIRKKLTDEIPKLPAGVKGPYFNDDYADAYFALYALRAHGLPHRELVKTAEQIRQRLLNVNGAQLVDILGEQSQRIYVEFSYHRLAALGVTPDALANALASRNDLTPAGFIDTAGPRVQIRPDGAFRSIDDVRSAAIELGGRTLKIGDIATVRRGYEDPATFKILVDGEPALMLGLKRLPKFNGLKLDENLSAEEARIDDGLPAGMSLVKVADQAVHITAAVDEFTVKFVVALGAVMLATLLTLGVREGIVVAAAVPLTLAATFIVMLLNGHNIDLVSLGALIVSLGLLVDDAIISIEMMVVRMRQGADRTSAASHAWNATAGPMLSGTLISIIGFIPIGLAPSGVSEFSGDLFWVVAYALIASWFVAVIMIPYLGVKLLPEVPVSDVAPSSIYETPRYQKLRGWIELAVTRKKMVALIVAGLFAAALVVGALLPLQFFPNSDRPELLVTIQLPQGSAIAATEKIATQVATLIGKDADVVHVATFVGAGSPRFFVSLNPELPDPAFAKLLVITKGHKHRIAALERIRAMIAENRFPAAELRVRSLSMGPPVPYPVTFRVVGPDMTVLHRIALQVADVMRTEPTGSGITIEAGQRAPAMRLRFDQERLRQIGLDPQSVSNQVHMMTQGRTATSIRDDLRSVDVVVRAQESDRRDLGSLGDIPILTRSGTYVPLSQVATIETVMEEPLLSRYNRENYIAVNAGILDTSQAPDVSNAMSARLKPLMARLPEGYHIDAGGEMAESNKANGAIAAMLPLMVMLMLAVIMIQVRSFPAMFLVIATAPLGVIGGLPALMVARAPFGFTAILGLIGLAGIVMRNTLILVDQIRQNKSAGMNDRRAVVEATVSRARPVMLTAIAAVLAFAPLTQSTFWGGLAIVLIGGTLVGTGLTIFFLPALYALWFRIGNEDAAPVPGPSSTIALGAPIG